MATWNGPLGAFEFDEFTDRTVDVARAMHETVRDHGAHRDLLQLSAPAFTAGGISHRRPAGRETIFDIAVGKTY